ncbi:MAG: cell division protein FtsA [Firmicutes bacterium]|nr:cell division protein FtsA [Bacillota bacterium]
MAKRRALILTGLDVGTSETVAIIADGGAGVPRILGEGRCPSTGLHKGAVREPESTAKCVKKALEMAEKAAGIKATSVYAGYNSVNSGVRAGRLVFTAGDIHRMRNGGFQHMAPGDFALSGIPSGERILYIIPGTFSDQVKTRADKDALVITGDSGEIEMLVSSIKMAGFSVEEVVYTPLAGAAALLSPAEIELGTVLMDIGAETASVSLFNRGFLKNTVVLPVGGGHVVSDLAVGLRTSWSQAEEILKNFGRLSPYEDEPSKEIEISGLDGLESKTVSGEMVTKIIEARVLEIIDLAGSALKYFGYSGLLPGGVVLTGCIAQLPGLAGIAEKQLELPVRVKTVELGGRAYCVSCTNAIGLVKYGAFKHSQDGNGSIVSKLIGGFRERVFISGKK